MQDFNLATLRTELKDGILKAGYTKPTEAQAKAIPMILDGKDIIVQSQTGTGKTAAFAIPILNSVDESKGLQCLVLVPTRELAVQVTNEFRILGKFTTVKALAIYGGQKMDIQLRALQNFRNQIVVSTPGRLLDHLERGTIKLGNVKFLVLDEADRMLDMGFERDLNAIMQRVPKERQTLLFSATMPQPIQQIAHRYMKNPQKIVIGHITAVKKIQQTYYYVNPKEKIDALMHILKTEKPEMALVFCSTRTMVDRLDRILSKKGYSVESLHGGHTQSRRENVMKGYKAGHSKILIATDVASRGLHVEGISHVINYDPPNDVETYIHRIGRTGRMEKEGKSISIFTPRDKPFLGNLTEREPSLKKAEDFKTSVRSVSQEEKEQTYERPKFFRR
jgi:ATP-dependent RNA helicase DeaD